jgi:L-aminopeptidase/D-esterase-like protein
VGAGTGATVGKAAGQAFATKGGIGSASALLPSGHTMGALVAVNAAGDVYDPDTTRVVAGARAPDGKGWFAQSGLVATSYAGQTPGTNTTLAIIATDAPWGKAELGKLAQMAHDGLARAIRPVHTPMDGDIVFALSTARATSDGSAQPATGASTWPIQLALTGEIAAQTLARAVVKAVRAATSLHGVPAVRDL